MKEVDGIKNIREEKNIKGKKILLRLDLNVPIKKGAVANDFRIDRAMPALQYLRKKKAKIIIISHIGRDKKDTLKPVAEYMNKKIRISFCKDTIGESARHAIEKMKDGDILLLENLRKYDGEIENDIGFARKLSELGDIYVNDAFSNSHRKHASMVLLPKLLPSYASLLLLEEIKNLKKAFNPPHPFLFILGGAKPYTKIPLIKRYITTADIIFVGGALMNNFYKEFGYSLGRSTVLDQGIKIASMARNKKIILPVDVVVRSRGKVKIKTPDAVGAYERIMDIGPISIELLSDYVKKSKFILFNGPLGNYEEGFADSTREILGDIAKSNAISIIGGGDTALLACCSTNSKKFSFISTGGGAMIEFLAKGTLPAIEALKRRKKKK